MAAISPYGSWTSPVNAELLTQATRGFEQLGLQDGQLWWREARPSEQARSTIVTTANGHVHSALPAPHSARSRVHEYGGASAIAVRTAFYFVEHKTQHLCELTSDGRVLELVDTPGLRLADFEYDAARKRLLAVAEHHRGEVVDNYIARIAIDGSTPANDRIEPLIAGNDFYAAPKLSPNGRHLAYLTWNHPHMPFEAAALWLAELDASGNVVRQRHIVGDDSGPAFQPEWTPSGALICIREHNGWLLPHRLNGSYDNGAAQPILIDQAEYGLPLWSLGMRSYTVIDDDTLVAQRIENGVASLVRVNIGDGSWVELPSGYEQYGQILSDRECIYFIGQRCDTPSSIVRKSLHDGGESEIASDPAPIAAADISVAERVCFDTPDGPTYAWLYPPRNSRHTAPTGELPPMVVVGHGGPTSAASRAFDVRVQYFTTRGWAVLDVDYGGSTGYGRAYRRRLLSQWGIVDVRDLQLAARHVVAAGLADGTRVAIRGRSAGGYTTLAALAFGDTFRAGASYYGIGDLSALAAETHKFEAHYTDSLIAPYPHRKDVYDARSPIKHLERFDTPVIFLQGMEDKVVPPNQAQAMYDALRAKGVAVACVLFENEGHGFRNAANIKAAIEAEYYFYARVFGFTPAETLNPIAIDNLR